MFSCCHPRLAEDAQVALILNILCGFSVDEVAAAYLSSHAAVEKRIPRAKKTLAEWGPLFDLTSAGDFAERLPAVQRALYLLFNEGYHGASAAFAVRTELCEEAMRLCALLLEHPQGATPSTCALAALMNLHAARLPARMDAAGRLLTLAEQDRGAWDQARVAQGLQWLEQSARGEEVTAYHLEAGIAAVHARAARPEETDWAQIVALYDALLAVAATPVVALNRAIAVGQCSGPEAGLAALRALPNPERLNAYPFYHAAYGEMELRRGDAVAARGHFAAALDVARNDQERHHLERRIAACVNRPVGQG
jgi:RNA polymerase sigma-70 factor (ECF subfamily)